MIRLSLNFVKHLILFLVLKHDPKIRSWFSTKYRSLERLQNLNLKE